MHFGMTILMFDMLAVDIGVHCGLWVHFQVHKLLASSNYCSGALLHVAHSVKCHETCCVCCNNALHKLETLYHVCRCCFESWSCLIDLEITRCTLKTRRQVMFCLVRLQIVSGSVAHAFWHDNIDVWHVGSRYWSPLRIVSAFSGAQAACKQQLLFWSTPTCCS